MAVDSLDIHLIRELDLNSRQPVTRLAKKLGVSREVVNYRIKRLLDRGTIRKFLTVLDYSRLGYFWYKIYFRFQNLDEEKEQEMITYIINKPSIVWAGSCDGKYDFICGIRARNLRELNAILEDINMLYGDYFKERDIASILEALHYNRKYLSEEKVTEITAQWGSSPTKVKIDKLDTKILNALAKDARMRVTDIANSLKVSSNTILKHIRRLEKEGLIQSYMIFLNNIKFDQLYYKVLISMETLSREKEREFLNFCRLQPNIVYLVKSFGDWQIELDIEVKDITGFRKVMREIKKRFSDIIIDYTALLMYDEYKFEFSLLQD